MSETITDDAMTRWRGVVTTIERFTDHYLANPEQLALDHIQVEEGPARDEIQPAPFGRDMYHPRNRRAAIMRALAKRDVPAEFRWDVQETIGGGAYLVLLNWMPPDGEPNATEKKDAEG